MPDLQAQKVAFAGHGSSDDGRFGILLFRRPDGEALPLAIPLEQLPTLLKAVAAAQTEANGKRSDDGVTARPVPIERWRTRKAGDSAILTLTIFGDVDLEFVVTPETVQIKEP
jgi:hypothetical protein